MLSILLVLVKILILTPAYDRSVTGMDLFRSTLPSLFL